MAPQRTHSDERYRDARCQLAVEHFDTPDGPIRRAVIHHPGAVGVIVRPDPDHLVMVRQFRYPIQAWTLEIPAGTRDRGEDPQDTALRELEEEAGLVAGRFEERVRMFPAVGLSDEELIIYEAFDCQPGTKNPDQGELIAVETVALADLAQHRRSGLICDAKTLIALSLIGCADTIVVAAP